VPIHSITAAQMKERAEINQDRELDYGERTNPFYVVLAPSGEVIDKIGGYNEPRVFVQFLEKSLERLPPPLRVAQTTVPARPATKTQDARQNMTGN
jgi:thiol:disulfide interchange protein DsbD